MAANPQDYPHIPVDRELLELTKQPIDNAE